MQPARTGSPATSNTVTMTVNPNLPVSVSVAPSANPVCCRHISDLHCYTNQRRNNSCLSMVFKWQSCWNKQFNLFLCPGNRRSGLCRPDFKCNSCPTGSPATSNTVTMTVNPNLPVSVTVAPSANPVCAGTSVTFTATPTNGGTTPAYQWYLNGGPVGTNSPTYSYVPATGDQVYVVLTSNATPVRQVIRQHPIRLQ